MTHIRNDQYISSECHNCEKDAEQTDTEVESHWTVAYMYKCGNCGTEFNWSKVEEDGLTGWALTIDVWGDIAKTVDGVEHPDATEN